jgi:hypothetical protein
VSPKEDRDAILARRRLLIVSALAGVVATGCRKSEPRACLNVSIVNPDGEAPETPTSDDDAGATPVAADAASADAGTSAHDAAESLTTTIAGDAAIDAEIPRPRVCLSPRRPP